MTDAKIIGEIVATDALVMDEIGSSIEFMVECGRYFERLPSNGEDRTIWANTYNAKNCARVIDTIRALKEENATLRDAIKGAAVITNTASARIRELEEENQRRKINAEVDANTIARLNHALSGADAQVEKLTAALGPFAVVGRAIQKAAHDARWLETPLFYAGSEEDPQSMTLTGRAFDAAAKAMDAALTPPAPEMKP